MIYCSVRLERLAGMRELRAESDHANRTGPTARERVRPGADSRRNLHYRPWAPPPGTAECVAREVDYVADFAAMCAVRGVGEGHGAAPVAHVLCTVSREWIEAGGDVHDPDNPRNRAFFEVCIKWAEVTFGGTEVVLAARMDLDEAGAGQVDLFVAPIAVSKFDKKYLCCSPILSDLQKRYRRRRSFAALQDCFAEALKEHLDPAIERGREKEGSGPDRVTPENYAARKDNERDRAKIEAERAQMDEDRFNIAISRLGILRTRQLQANQTIAQKAALAKQAADLIRAREVNDERGRLLARVPALISSTVDAFLDGALKLVNENGPRLVASSPSDELARDAELVNRFGLVAVFERLQALASGMAEFEALERLRSSVSSKP